MLMFVSLGLFACGKDPYEKMSMSLSKSEVNLTLIEDKDTNLIVGTPESISVEVEAPKNVSAEIVLPEYGDGYGDEYVSIEIESEEAGKYVLKLTAKKQGKTEIQVKTAEGNITKVISVNIDVAVNAIAFKQDALAAIEIGSTYDFNVNGRSLIDYTPSYTSQTDVDFYIADEFIEYIPSGVQLVDNVLTINKGVDINNFPLYSGEDGTYNYMLLSARSKHNVDVVTTNTFRIRVINPLDLTSNNVGARMYYEDSATNLRSVEISKKVSTETRIEYELTFASHYAGQGEVQDKFSKYSLMFGGMLDLYLNNTSDYKIVFDKSETDVVDISEDLSPSIPDLNANYHLYKDIQSGEVGTYVANFRVEYTGGTDNGQFDGLFTKYIQIKINVIALPTNSNIAINGQAYKDGNNILAVYDYYQNAIGTQLSISSDLCTNMQFSIGEISEVGMGPAGVSIKDGKNQEITDTSIRYNNADIIYLKNNTTETSTVEFEILLYCNVYNEYYLNSYVDDVEKEEIRQLQTYVKKIKIKLNLISGLESIEFVDSEPFVIDIIADKDGAIFYSFAEGVIAEGVVQAITYQYGSHDLFSYRFEDNHIIFVPNSDFLEGKDSIKILLTNGVESTNARQVIVKIPYEIDPETNKELVINKLDTKNEGFFAFGSIDATNTSYGSNFADVDDIIGYYTSETGKKDFVDETGVYKFDNFNNLIISTYADIELHFYRLLIYNEEIKYTNVDTLSIVSSNRSKLFWANGHLFSTGDTTYNELTKTHAPLTLTIKNGDDVLQVINVFICQRIEQVVLSKEIFELYTEQTLNPLYLEKSRELVKIDVTRNDEFSDIADTNVEAGYYGNIYSNYRMIGDDDIIFSFVNKNLDATEEQKVVKVLKSYLLKLQEDLEIGMGGYVKMLQAQLTLPEYATFNGSNDQLLAEIFGKDGVTIKFSGVIRQFNQEFPVEFSVNVKYAIETNNNIVTTLNDETGIYFEQKTDDEIELNGNNLYSFDYNVFPTNATFKQIFVQMQKVNDDSINPVKTAVSYTKRDGKFVDYGYYETGNFDPRVYFGTYATQDQLKDVEFLIEIYAGRITIRQVNATAGTYIFSIVTLDSYFASDECYSWVDEDPTQIAFEENIMGFQGFNVEKQFNLSIADGSKNAPYQIRTTSNMIDFLSKNKNGVVSGKYYVVANDIFFNKSFTNDVRTNGYKYEDYISELNNNLSGQFTKYLLNGEKEIYNRVVYSFNIDLKNVSTDMNIGLFTSIADDYELTYFSLGNSTINVSTLTNRNVSINVGGLVGKLDSEGQIIGGKVQGNINVEINKEDNLGVVNIGGIVGYAIGNGSINSIPDTSLNVNNSDINSNVAIRYVGKNANLGGIVGYAEEIEINNVRTIPSIMSVDKNGNYSESNIGGIVGYTKKANIKGVVVYPIIVGHSNIGGIAGIVSGGIIEDSQVQILYNINMKNVIAGYNNVGGVIGKIVADETTQTTNLNYVYVRSYTTKEINLFDTTESAVNNFHTLYTNKYYGAVVLLPTNDALKSEFTLGGIVGVSEAGDNKTNTLNINSSYFASHAVSFNEVAKIAGVVGKFVDYESYKNKLNIFNSYVDGIVTTIYKDVNGDIVNNFSLNFITSTKTNDGGSTISEGTETITYDVKGNLSSEINSYLTITQTKVVSNVIMTYTDTYANVENGEFVYAKLNNSLFGLSNKMEGSKFSYSGYTSNTERTTIIIANIAKNVSEDMLAMFAKYEKFENTPTGNFYYSYLLNDSNTITDAQLSYMSTELSQLLLQNKFYELHDNKVRPDIITAGALTGSATFDDSSSDEALVELLIKFVNIEDANLDKIFNEVSSKCTSLISNSLNDSVVNITRTISVIDGSVNTEVKNGIPYIYANFNVNGTLLEYVVTADGYALKDSTIVDAARLNKRFILLGGRPIKLGNNILDVTNDSNSPEILKLFKIEYPSGLYENYGLHEVNGKQFITKIEVSLENPYLSFTDIYGASTNTGVWSETITSPYFVADDKGTADETDDEYYMFMAEPKLVYTDNTRNGVLNINELTNSIVIDGVTYSVVNGLLYDAINDKFFTKENVGYGINEKLAVSKDSVSLTTSKICNLVEVIDGYAGELNLSYSSMEDIFTQYGFKNFNGEYYNTNIQYTISGNINWDENTNAWYYDDECSDLVHETVVYEEGEETYKYEQYTYAYFDGINWYVVDRFDRESTETIQDALRELTNTIVTSLVVEYYIDEEGKYWTAEEGIELVQGETATDGTYNYVLNEDSEGNLDGTYTKTSVISGRPIYIIDGNNYYKSITEYTGASILSKTTFKVDESVTRYFDGTNWYEDEEYTTLLSDTSLLVGARAVNTISGDAFVDENGMNWYSNGELTNQLYRVLYVEKSIDESDNIIGSYEDKTFYQKGNWYYDEDYIQLVYYTDEVYDKLPKYFTEDTVYIVDGVKYYFTFKWYTDNSSSLELDSNSIEELDKNAYYFKETTYYKQYNWYLDNTAKKLVTDKEVLLYLSEKVGSEIPYNGEIYYYRANWFKDSKFSTLVSDEVILNLLNKVADYDISEDGSYNLKAWYYDNLYTQPIKELDSVESSSPFNIGLDVFNFEIGENDYLLSINDNIYSISQKTISKNEDNEDVVDYTSVSVSDLFTELGISSVGAIQSLMIVNDNIYLILNVLPDGVSSIDKVKVYNSATEEYEIHYVVAKIQLDFSNTYRWLSTNKVNSGMPVVVKPMIETTLTFDGAAYTYELKVEYQLIYDELATFTLYAQPFTKANNDDYVADDAGEEHSAHIKKDDNSVVLMYNKTTEERADVNTYKISFGEKIDGYYFAQLDGIVVDLSAIKIDKESAMQLVISSSDIGVVEIEKIANSDMFNVYVNGEGNAVLTFYNLKDDSIKVTLNVTVIKGFTNFEIYNDNNSQVSSLEAYVGGNPSYYNLGLVNNIGGVDYEANKGGYYVTVTSVDGVKDILSLDSNVKYSSVTMGNYLISGDSLLKTFEFTNPNISIQGNNCNIVEDYNGGFIDITIVPYVICDGEKVAIEELSIETTILVLNAARNISFAEKDATIIPDGEKEIAINVYSNKADESIKLIIDGTDLYWESDVISRNQYKNYLYNGDGLDGSLLNVRLKSSSTKLEMVGDLRMYRHTFVLVLTMNVEHYRLKTANDGINAIAKGVSYKITAIPETNDAISATFDFAIEPVIATELDYYMYPNVKDRTAVNSETLQEYVRYEINNFDSIFKVTPNSLALLKMDVYPKFSNILSYEVSVDSKFSKYIKFTQVTPYYAPDSTVDANSEYNYKAIDSKNVQVGNNFVMWDVPYRNGYLGNEGWVYTDWSFSEYFLMIKFDEKVTQGATIPFTINAYDYQRNVIFTYTINVEVEFIPYLDMSIDGSNEVVYGLDEYAKIDIESRNVDEVYLQTNGLELYVLEKGEYVKQTNNGTSYEFTLDLTKQYYVNTKSIHGEVNKIGKPQLRVFTSKVINGTEFIAESKVTIQVVYLTIESVRELDAINDVVTMKTGMYLGLEAVIQTNKVDLEKLDYVINGLSALAYINDLQRQISGQGIYDENNWWYSTGYDYEKLDDSKNYPGFTFSRQIDTKIEETFYRINASQIATPKLQLRFHYFYTGEGTIVIGDYNHEKYDDTCSEVFIYEYVFTVNIKDNSTEDTPVPIYTVEEFMNMQENVNYILQSDLELNYWAPMEFNSAYLDGNGFTITINSFNLSELKGQASDVFAGIFSKIKAGCIVKNVNINISPLLYTNSMLNKVINEEVEPNIDLRETNTVYFGVLAGENEGTIINVKIINIDNRKYGNTLYVGMTRGYYKVNDSSTLSTGYIGTMVGSNIGVITNSFAGVNNESSLERTGLTNQANKFVSIYTKILPFSLAGTNNIGGFVARNSGTVSNCYVKGVNITNTTRISNNSSSAGFVAINSGSVHTSAVTSNSVVAFRSTDIKVVSSAITAGFVYENSGEIQDAYTTIQLDNKNVDTAGFVYRNTEDGVIKNAYTTSKNVSTSLGGGNTTSHSLFVGEKAEYGYLENCYYLVLGTELGEEIKESSSYDILKTLDPAIAVKVDSQDVISKDMFSGFDFVDNDHSYDGTWYLVADAVGQFPKLQFAENLNYYSRRELADIITTTFKLVDDRNINLVNAEGGVESSWTTSQKTDEVIFSDNGTVFAIMSDHVFDLTSNVNIDVVKNADTYQFVFNDKQYAYTLSEDGDDYITINNITDGRNIKVQNFVFDYMKFEFVLVKYSSIDASHEPIYEMYMRNGYSIKQLTSKENNTFVYAGNTTYTYSYAKNNVGSKFNPIVISNAKEFAKYITTNTNEYRVGTKKAFIFGLVENNGNGVNARYVQIVNDIDFSDENINTKYEVNNTASVIGVSDVIFNGVLMGNAMKLSNIRIVSNVVRENFGIFDSIGVNDELRIKVAEDNGVGISNMQDSVVFDLDLEYDEFSNSEANKVGLLAGTITNATISKIDISGAEEADDTNEIRGKNLVGALAGLIIGQSNRTKVNEITVTNITVISDRNNIKNLDIDYSATTTEYREFSKLDTNLELVSTKHEELVVEYKVIDEEQKVLNITNLNNLSYAGGVAGAIVVDSQMKMDNGEANTKYTDAYASYVKLRENKIYATISGLTVKGAINIQSDISGGIVGYVGSPRMEELFDNNSGTSPDYIKSVTGGVYLDNLYVELSNEQPQSIFGYAYSGGIVGQSKNAYFTKAIISYPEEIQKTIDANINSIDADKVSSNTLFSKAGSHVTTIASGGVAGYMSNTWVVDSAIKVNVYNPQAYMAGGIAGRSDGNIYLAYVYTIGNVKAKNIIGGLIGYYYDASSIDYEGNDASTYYNPFDLHMFNAFAVNIWSKDVKDLIKTNSKAYEYTAMFNFKQNDDGSYLVNPDAEEKGKRQGILEEYKTGKKFNDFTSDTIGTTDTSGQITIQGEKSVLKEQYGIDLDAIQQAGFNSMPELGNQNIPTSHSLYDKDGNLWGYSAKINKNFTGFSSNERFTYIGSVLGRYTKPIAEDPDIEGTENPERFSNIVFYNDLNSIYQTSSGYNLSEVVSVISNITSTDMGDTWKGDEKYYTYYNNQFFNVISSTYGKVQHKGELNQGNYESVIADDKLNLSYFKSVYNSDTFSGPNADGKYFTPNIKYDNVNKTIYNQVFGKQYYTSYITGDFINNDVFTTGTGNKYYRNEFSLYQGFAFDSGVNLSVLDKTNSDNENQLQTELISNLNASTVWYVQAEEYLAKYGYNVNGTFNLIYKEEDLFDAFIKGDSNKLYKLTPYNEVESGDPKPLRPNPNTDPEVPFGNLTDASVFDLTSYANSSEWYEPTRITVNNNSYFADSANPITIKFKVTHANKNKNSGSADDSQPRYMIYGLFDTIVGCTFSNINFLIDVTDIKDSEVYTNNKENHLGLFANVVNSCTFINCKFTYVSDNEQISINIGNETNVTNANQVKDFGLVFGFSLNSSIRNTSFEFEKPINISYTNIQNVTDLVSAGILAGQTEQTTIQNVDINSLNKKSLLFNYAVSDGCTEIVNHNFGGLVGYSQNAKYENIANYMQVTHNLTNLQSAIKNTHNLGALFGVVESSLTMKDIVYYGSYSVKNTDKYNQSTINAGLIGQLSSTSVLKLKAEKVSSDTMAVNTRNKFLNVGMIGVSTGGNSINSVINELPMYILNNYIEVVKVSGVDTNAYIFNGNIGGITGKEENASTYSNCINSGDITITVGNNGVESLNVGGFIGCSKAGMIENSYNIGNIYIDNVIAPNDSKTGNGYVYVGGFVGKNEYKTYTINTSIVYGDIYYHDVNNSNYFMGGLIGHNANKKLELENTLSFVNFIRLDNNNTNYFVPQGSKTESRINAMANNMDSTSKWANSYFVSEHDPVHSQDTDNNNYALLSVSHKNYIDMLCNSDLSTDKAFYEVANIAWNASVTGSRLPYIIGLETKYINNRVEDGSKHKPSVGNSTIPTTFEEEDYKKYFIIDTSILVGGEALYGNQTNVVSGLEIPSGVVITGENTTGTNRYYVKSDFSTPFIDTNKGVISNILFTFDKNDRVSTSESIQLITVNNSAQNQTLFMNTNFGHIMNTAFTQYDKNGVKLTVNGTGSGEVLISVIKENNGGVYTSGTQITYKNNSVINKNIAISYLVGINNGAIKNCYSTSNLTATSTAETEITFGAMAGTNNVKKETVDGEEITIAKGVIGSCVFGGTFIVENADVTSNKNYFVGVNNNSQGVSNVFSDKSQINGANQTYSYITELGAIRDEGEFVANGNFGNNSIYWDNNKGQAAGAAVINNTYPYIYNGIRIVNEFSESEEIYIYTSRQLAIVWNYFSVKDNNSKIIIDIDTSKVSERVNIASRMQANKGVIVGTIEGASSSKNIVFEQGFVYTNDAIINLTMSFVNINNGNFITTNNGQITVSFDNVVVKTKDGENTLNNYFIQTNENEVVLGKMTTSQSENSLRINNNKGNLQFAAESNNYKYIISSNSLATSKIFASNNAYIKGQDGAFEIADNNGIIDKLLFNTAYFKFIGNNPENNGTISNISVYDSNMYVGDNYGTVDNIYLSGGEQGNLIDDNYGTLNKFRAYDIELHADIIYVNYGTISGDIIFEEVESDTYASLLCYQHYGTLNSGKIEVVNSEMVNGSPMGFVFADVYSDISVPITITNSSINGRNDDRNLGFVISSVRGATISGDIKVDGTITLTDGGMNIGGVVGNLIESTITGDIEASVNISVNGGGIKLIGGVVGCMIKSTIDGSINVNGSDITIGKPSNYYYIDDNGDDEFIGTGYIGGVIGRIMDRYEYFYDYSIDDYVTIDGISTINGDISVDGMTIALRSGANAKYVGGIFGAVGSTTINSSKLWFINGVINCAGLTVPELKVPKSWTSVKSALQQWWYVSGTYTKQLFVAVQGFDLKAGFICGDKLFGNDSTNSTLGSSVTGLGHIKLLTIEFSLTYFNDGDGPYYEERNNRYFAIEFYYYNSKLSDFKSTDDETSRRYDYIKGFWYRGSTKIEEFVNCWAKVADHGDDGYTGESKHMAGRKEALKTANYVFEQIGSGYGTKFYTNRRESSSSKYHYYINVDKWIIWKGGRGSDTAASVFHKDDHQGMASISFRVTELGNGTRVFEYHDTLDWIDNNLT